VFNFFENNTLTDKWVSNAKFIVKVRAHMIRRNIGYESKAESIPTTKQSTSHLCTGP
jgi:hypothetical protein